MSSELQATAPTLPQPSVEIAPRDYIDKNVVNTKGDNIGVVIRLLIHAKSQQIYAVVNTGKFMGVSGRQIALAISQLQAQGQQLMLVSDFTRLQLESSMRFDESEFRTFKPQYESVSA